MVIPWKLMQSQSTCKDNISPLWCLLERDFYFAISKVSATHGHI